MLAFKMNQDRATIEFEIKNEVVSFLRENGFKGSFPDFYRERNEFVRLINFQFFSSGGSFCVTLSYADPPRNNVSFRPETESKKLRVSQTKERLRLGSNGPGSDHWFSFGETSYGESRGQPIPAQEISRQLKMLLSSQAEKWWRQKCA